MFVFLEFFAFTLFAACSLFADNTAVMPSGYGTSSNPFKMTRIENFVWLGENLSSLDHPIHLSLQNDIDATETYEWNDGMGFKPIGSYFANNFSGKINGNGHSIIGLYINRDNSYHIGLFSSVKKAEFLNLNMSNAFVAGSGYVGVLSGMAEESSFFNCNVYSSEVKGIKAHIGGLAGYAAPSNSFEDCTFCGNIDGRSYLGGIAGSAKSSMIRGSYSESIIGSGDVAIGGIVGNAESSDIVRCKSFIDSSAATNAFGSGGIAGFGGANIKQSCAFGIIGGMKSIGGLLGVGGDLIENCYVRCVIQGDTEVGGIVGSLDYPCVIVNSYTLGDIDANSSYGEIVGINSYYCTFSNVFYSLRNMDRWEENRKKMLNKSTFENWDFDTIWNINDGCGFPYFKWETPEPSLVIFLSLLFIFSQFRK